jgi:hypothetical protein
MSDFPSSTDREELAEKLATIPLDQLHFGWPTTVPIRLSETEREMIVNALRGVAQAVPEPVGHRWRWKGVEHNANPWRYGHGNYRGSLVTADVEPLYASPPAPLQAGRRHSHGWPSTPTTS